MWDTPADCFACSPCSQSRSHWGGDDRRAAGASPSARSARCGPAARARLPGRGVTRGSAEGTSSAAVRPAAAGPRRRRGGRRRGHPAHRRRRHCGGDRRAAMRALAKLEQVLPARLRSQVSRCRRRPSRCAGPRRSTRRRCSRWRRPAATSCGRASATAATTARAPTAGSSRTGWCARAGAGTSSRATGTGRPGAASGSTGSAMCRHRAPVRPDGSSGCGGVRDPRASTGVYPCRARVRLSLSAERAAEWVAPSTGVLVPIDAAHCALTTGADTWEAIALHLARLGCDFEVLEPPALGEAVRALANRLLRGVGERRT